MIDMTLFNFKVTLQPEEDGPWSAWLSSYPACSVWGHSESEAIEALKEMFEVFVGVMQDSGEVVYADSVEDENVKNLTGAVPVGEASWDSASVKNDTLSVPVYA